MAMHTNIAKCLKTKKKKRGKENSDYWFVRTRGQGVGSFDRGRRDDSKTAEMAVGSCIPFQLSPAVSYSRKKKQNAEENEEEAISLLLKLIDKKLERVPGERRRSPVWHCFQTDHRDVVIL